MDPINNKQTTHPSISQLDTTCLPNCCAKITPKRLRDALTPESWKIDPALEAVESLEATNGASNRYGRDARAKQHAKGFDAFGNAHGSLDSNVSSTILVEGNSSKGGYVTDDCLFQKVSTQFPIRSVLALLLVLLLPIFAFWRGVLACVLTLHIVRRLWAISDEREQRRAGIKAARRQKWPQSDEEVDVQKLQCAGSAYKYVRMEPGAIRIYAGWMNTVDVYDATTHRLAFLRPVYVQLIGSTLIVSETNAPIRRRSIWNEPKYRTDIVYTRKRRFNMLDCRVEFLPEDLPRRKHYLLKYPLLLTLTRGFTYSALYEEKIASPEKQKPGEGSQSDGNDSDDLGNVQLIDERKRRKQQGRPLTPSSSDDITFSPITKPTVGDERLILFGRDDRAKETWYYRFLAASAGDVQLYKLQLPTAQVVSSGQMKQAAANAEKKNAATPPSANDDRMYDGLTMSECTANNRADYIRFMTLAHSACGQCTIPVYSRAELLATQTIPSNYRHRRQSAHYFTGDLWRGIGQSLFLRPAGSLVWLNFLVGRILFGFLRHRPTLDLIIARIQRKLDSIKLPGFIENIVIRDLELGNTPPIIHQISQPTMDERGIWIDADLTYKGHIKAIVTVRLNMEKLQLVSKKHPMPGDITVTQLPTQPTDNVADKQPEPEEDDDPLHEVLSSSDSSLSDASDKSDESEDTEDGADEFAIHANDPDNEEVEVLNPKEGQPRGMLKKVADNFYQYAYELPMVQRALGNINQGINLHVIARDLVARFAINIAPPPSDNLWLCFRGPPRLNLSAKPSVGEKQFHWTFLTSLIERYIREGINLVIVYPNMIDIRIAVLGESETFFKMFDVDAKNTETAK